MFTDPDRTRWEGQDAIILGGGASLATFDFDLLRGRNVIGCNVAYLKGPEICPVTLFSDLTFFNLQDPNTGLPHSHGLREYVRAGGEVWTICEDLYPREDVEDFMFKIRRQDRGLHPAWFLGFGGNTGCAAINLALIFGAKRVGLLGMDCKISNGEKNWHDLYPEKIPENQVPLFKKFDRGFHAAWANLPVRFPGRSIVNLGPDSALTYFPKEDYRSWLAPQTISYPS